MVRTVGSRSGARNVRVLSPAFIAKQWKRGQSGNPAGHAAEYGEVVRLAKSLSVRAIERLGELMESDDERVAAVACNMILDRAFGKALTQRLPVQDSLEERLRAMTPEQREAEAHALYDPGPKFAWAGSRLALWDEIRARWTGAAGPDPFDRSATGFAH